MESLVDYVRSRRPDLPVIAPVDLNLQLDGVAAGEDANLVVTRTARGLDAEPLGRVHLGQDGGGQLALPPRSLTTLFPAGRASSGEAS